MNIPSVPCSLSLPGIPGDTSLQCERAVRTLPGRRLVCAGSWHARNVYIKLFFDAHTAKRDWEREKRGIQYLYMSGILTPALLYSGYLPDRNSYILVLASVEPATTLKQAWEQAKTRDEKLSLLRSMAQIFASHHNAGLIHHDPHLNNFLLSSDGIHTLDGAEVESTGRPVTIRRGLSNIAAFFATLHLGPGEPGRSFFDAYTANMERGTTPLDYPRFLKQVRKTQGKQTRKYLYGKIFRDCTDYSRTRTFRRLTMLSRSHDSPNMQAVLASPEAFLHGHDRQLLKEGNTSTVVMTEIDNTGYVIKHYRIKGPLHGLRKAFARTRAEKSWINAHRMQITGIMTATPVAIIVNTTGPLRHDAFYITEHLNGELLKDYLATAGPADMDGIACRLAGLLQSLATRRITHGDMKASNIIVTNDSLALMDLDSMKQHRSGILFRMQFRKDLERFRRNWPAGSDFSVLIEKHIKTIIDEFV